MTQYSDGNWNDPNTPTASGGGGMAIASLVLGIIGMLAWCFAICGVVICIVGLILGIKDLKGPKRTIAIWGVSLNGIGLALSVINLIAGLLMMASGTHPMMNP